MFMIMTRSDKSALRGTYNEGSDTKKIPYRQRNNDQRNYMFSHKMLIFSLKFCNMLTSTDTYNIMAKDGVKL